MFPTAFALTPHGQTGALAQQVQTRYLSIIIVPDNGDALDASNYRKNETGIIQSQLRHVRSRGASLCTPPVRRNATPFFVFQKKTIREHESRGDRSLLIDVEILNAHRICRTLVAQRLVTFMTLSRSLNIASKKNPCLEKTVINTRRCRSPRVTERDRPRLFRVCMIFGRKFDSVERYQRDANANRKKCTLVR